MLIIIKIKFIYNLEWKIIVQNSLITKQIKVKSMTYKVIFKTTRRH